MKTPTESLEIQS